MKKFFALLLVVVLCAAMMVPAFAENAAPTGTLTITNAENGKTYYVVRVFNADTATHGVGSDATTTVSYTVADSTADTSLYQLITKNTTYKVGDTTIQCPFQIDTTHDAAGATPVSHKTPVNGQSAEFGRGWLYGMYKSGQWVPDEANVSSAKLSENGTSIAVNTLTFSGLPYGYYMVFAEGADIASVISITKADNTIIDKNTRTPGDPDKKIKLENGSLVGSMEGEIGDEITYVASFQATNYRTVASDMKTTQITKYSFSDTATGVKYASMDSIEIYRNKNSKTGAFSDKIATLEGVQYIPTYDKNNNIVGYHAEIDWVDADGNSLYPSPCYVVVTYRMWITDRALTIANGNKAVNTFAPNFVVDDTEIPIDPKNPPSVTVYTTGLSLRKIDEHNNGLEGAKFKLAKVDDEGNETFYKLTEETSTVTGEKWHVAKWVAEDEAPEVEAKNSSLLQTFGGLKSGTYHLYETTAPKGFYAPTIPWIIEIAYNDKNGFSAQISADNGKTFTDLSLATDGANTYNYFTASIVNTSASPLPQTGAEGTTLLLISGTVLFMGTMLLLVTKKRMYNENF